MNAYELADELADTGKFFKDRLYEQASTMLRQQADELIDAGGMISMLREKLAQQADEIKKLKEWKSFPEDASYFEVYNPWNMNQVLRFSKEFIEGYSK